MVILQATTDTLSSMECGATTYIVPLDWTGEHLEYTILVAIPGRFSNSHEIIQIQGLSQ